MQVNEARNAEAALVGGLWLMGCYGQPETSRGGPVLVMPSPVMTVTERPRERVVLAPWRDANPFFHLVESAWMLAGRDDTAFLTPYVKRMGQYGEQGTGRQHGAYGARWRSGFDLDQLNVLVRRLKVDPGDRQCVLQMWDASPLRDIAGHVVGHDDLTGQWKDRPCNTHCYLRVRSESRIETPRSGYTADNYTVATPVLDLTVCCRSNDMIWGAHGANAVHFSYLQEYLADRIGVGVGTMYQLSNNYHAYVDVYERTLAARKEQNGFASTTRYESSDLTWQPMRMVGEPALDTELGPLCALLEHVHAGDPVPPNSFGTAFARLVRLAALAHAQYRAGRYNVALGMAEAIEAPDWRAACVEWLDRRARHAAGSPAREGASLP